MSSPLLASPPVAVIPTHLAADCSASSEVDSSAAEVPARRTATQCTSTAPHDGCDAEIGASSGDGGQSRAEIAAEIDRAAAEIGRKRLPAQIAVEIEGLQTQLDALRERVEGGAEGGAEAARLKTACADLINRLTALRQRQQAGREVSEASEAASAGDAPSRVLVTTAASVRGLDLPKLDCVLLYDCPPTSDDYAHA